MSASSMKVKIIPTSAICTSSRNARAPQPLTFQKAPTMWASSRNVQPHVFRGWPCEQVLQGTLKSPHPAQVPSSMWGSPEDSVSPPRPCSKSLSICLNRGQQKQRCLQRFPRFFLQNISKHVFLKQFFVHSVQFFHTLLKSNFSVFCSTNLFRGQRALSSLAPLAQGRGLAQIIRL